MIEVLVIHRNPDLEKMLKELDYKQEFYFKFLDAGTRMDRSKCFKIKEDWGARLDPFILVSKDDKVIKAFYTEAGDAISEFLKYINNDCKGN